MPKAIVFLNLADMHQHGLAKKSTDALKQKYPSYNWVYEYLYGANRIQIVDLFQALDRYRWRQRFPINSLSILTAAIPELTEMMRISQLCAEADKIMLGIHGYFDNQEQGFAGLGWQKGGGPIGTVYEFAELLAKFLLPNRPYRIALIVCFGARSANYRKNHEGELDEEDIKSSFAYRFYKHLIRHTLAHPITLTARTGSVGFNSQTGRSEVQTEAAVAAQIEQDELQHGEKVKAIGTAYKQLQAEMTSTMEGGEKFFAIREAMEDPHAIPQTREEQIIKDYLRIQVRAHEIHDREDEDSSKYGKFVYTYDGATVTVYRKYTGGQKMMTVLYNGPL